MSRRGAADPVLPDVLGPELAVVFCGSAVGRKSAAAGAYYAGPGNRFWATLHEIGLTPRRLDPHEYPGVIGYGIGLTDLAKHRSGGDRELRESDDDVAGLTAKIAAWAPRALAFNGKRAAERVLGRPAEYGPQRERLGGSRAFVLPSTSGAARRYWNIAEWRALASWVNGLRHAPG